MTPEFPVSGGGFVSVGPVVAGTALGPMAMGTAVGWQYVTIPPPPATAPLTREQVQAIEDRAAEAERVRLVNERRVRAAEARGRARGRRLAAEDVEAELEAYRAELLARLDDGDGMPS